MKTAYINLSTLLIVVSLFAKVYVDIINKYNNITIVLEKIVPKHTLGYFLI